jgi:hypothetical protein
MGEVLTAGNVDEAPRRAARSLTRVAVFMWGSFFFTFAVFLGIASGSFIVFLTLSVLAVGATFLVLSAPAHIFCPTSKLMKFSTDSRLQPVVDNAILSAGLLPNQVVGVAVSHPSYNCGAFPLRDGRIFLWITTPLIELYTSHELEAQLFSQFVVVTNKDLLRAARSESLAYMSLFPALCAPVVGFLFLPFFPFAPFVFLPYLVMYMFFMTSFSPGLSISRMKAADVVAAATTYLPKSLISSQWKLVDVVRSRLGLTMGRKADPYAALPLQKGTTEIHGGAHGSTTNSQAKAKTHYRAAHMELLLQDEEGKSGKEISYFEILSAYTDDELSKRVERSPFDLSDLFDPQVYDFPVPLEGKHYSLTDHDARAPAGWYSDPSGSIYWQRWWDGSRWTEKKRVKPPPK